MIGLWNVLVQHMPFLFANRVMVAKEAHTSSSAVKDLIVAAAGVEYAIGRVDRGRGSKS